MARCFFSSSLVECWVVVFFFSLAEKVLIQQPAVKIGEEDPLINVIVF